MGCPDKGAAQRLSLHLKNRGLIRGHGFFVLYGNAVALLWLLVLNRLQKSTEYR